MELLCLSWNVDYILLLQGIYVGSDFIGTVRFQTGPTLNTGFLSMMNLNASSTKWSMASSKVAPATLCRAQLSEQSSLSSHHSSQIECVFRNNASFA